MSDQEFLAPLRRGDEAAFDEIFRAWYPALVAFAERMLGERALAEEVAQEVMLEVWRRRQTLTVTESLRAYLLRATRNRALNVIRRAKLERETEPFLERRDAEGPVATAALETEEIDRAVREAVAALPPRCRAVFELSREHGLRYAEIAEVLGVSVKAVEAQMGRALKAMREKLAPWLA